ncbi:MAG: flagellar hook-basal body complex protein FliE, partial [Sphingomonadales bacterium]
AEAKPASFASTMEDALKSVNQSQQNASELSAAYERGETVDIAKVMLARQQASVGFEATLQVRNKLLSAYKDIMSMPV